MTTKRAREAIDEQACVGCGDPMTTDYAEVGDPLLWLCDDCHETVNASGALCAFGPAGEHDEAFMCSTCDRNVCGCCATAGEDDDWFCPECVSEARDAA